MGLLGTKPVYRAKEVEPFTDNLTGIKVHPHAKYSNHHFMIEVWQQDNAIDGYFLHVFFDDAQFLSIDTFGSTPISFLMLVLQVLREHSSQIIQYLVAAPWRQS